MASALGEEVEVIIDAVLKLVGFSSDEVTQRHDIGSTRLGHVFLTSNIDDGFWLWSTIVAKALCS